MQSILSLSPIKTNKLPNFVNRQCPLSSHDRNTMLQLKRQETDAKKLNIITLEEESVSPRFAPKSIDYFSMSSYSVNITSFYRHHSKVGEVILTHRVSEISFHPPQGREAMLGAARTCWNPCQYLHQFKQNNSRIMIIIRLSASCLNMLDTYLVSVRVSFIVHVSEHLMFGF